MKFWEWEGDVTTWPYLGLLGLGLYQMWRDFNKINDHNIATDSTPKTWLSPATRPGPGPGPDPGTRVRDPGPKPGIQYTLCTGSGIRHPARDESRMTTKAKKHVIS